MHAALMIGLVAAFGLLCVLTERPRANRMVPHCGLVLVLVLAEAGGYWGLRLASGSEWLAAIGGLAGLVSFLSAVPMTFRGATVTSFGFGWMVLLIEIGLFHL